MQQLGLMSLLVIDSACEAVVLLLSTGVQLSVALKATSQPVVLGRGSRARVSWRLGRWQIVAHLCIILSIQTTRKLHQITSHQCHYRPRSLVLSSPALAARNQTHDNSFRIVCSSSWQPMLNIDLICKMRGSVTLC